MESKTAQNVQDTYFNTVRKDKSPLTIYLVNGVRVHGRIRSFDKFSVIVESGDQEQLVFKHAISTVTTGAAGGRVEKRNTLNSFSSVATGTGIAMVRGPIDDAEPVPRLAGMPPSASTD